MMKFVLALGAALLALGCSQQTESLRDRGSALFFSKSASPSQLNLFSCSSCHDTASSSGFIKAGAALAGVTQRTSFWGGQENDLLESVNACRRYFMFANKPYVATDADAEALYEYLSTLAGGNSEAIPFTVVRTLEDVPRGDAVHGRVLYQQACFNCHGTIHDGGGRLDPRIPLLPEQTIAEHSEFTPRVQRLVFIEKIRHGLFLGYGGDMPPFSLEVLSNSDVSDILEAMGVLGQ